MLCCAVILGRMALLAFGAYLETDLEWWPGQPMQSDSISCILQVDLYTGHDARPDSCAHASWPWHVHVEVTFVHRLLHVGWQQSIQRHFALTRRMHDLPIIRPLQITSLCRVLNSPAVCARMSCGRAAFSC